MELAIHNIKGKDTGRKAKLSNNILLIIEKDYINLRKELK